MIQILVSGRVSSDTGIGAKGYLPNIAEKDECTWRRLGQGMRNGKEEGATSEGGMSRFVGRHS
jgi:hypothetical protein